VIYVKLDEKHFLRENNTVVGWCFLQKITS